MYTECNLNTNTNTNNFLCNITKISLAKLSDIVYVFADDFDVCVFFEYKNSVQSLYWTEHTNCPSHDIACKNYRLCDNMC